MTNFQTLSAPLRGFFEAEERNTREAIAQGDLDPGFPLTLSTALESLQQAPDDVILLWMTGDRNGDWGDAFGTLMELTAMFDKYGPDAELMEWLR